MSKRALHRPNVDPIASWRAYCARGDHRARTMLLRYNEDDCRATRAVRDFLTAGAPGVPDFGSV